jgi:hypothetical protein
MLAVQPVTFRASDEELATVRVRAAVGLRGAEHENAHTFTQNSYTAGTLHMRPGGYHGKQARTSVLADERLVIELVTVDAHSSCTITLQISI